MIAVFLGVPLLLLALVLTGAVWLLSVVLAAPPSRGPRRKKRLPYARIPGRYEPRWGAYRRGREARDKSQWDEDFQS